MSRKTFHGKNGKFTSFDRASTVTQGGERYKMVRTLEPMDAGEEDPAVEELRKRVSEFENRIAPRWLSLDEVFKR